MTAISPILRRASALFAPSLLALSLLAAPALAEDVTVTHARGEIAVPLKPETVLTFDLAALDTLAALGVKVAGVPTGAKPDYLSDYAGADVAKIGSFFEPDYEAVNALEPDLIIVAGRSAPKYDELAKFAPTVDLSVDQRHFLAGARQNILTLGTIFARQSEAEALAASLDAAAADLKQKASTAGRALLVLTTGGKISTYGPGSRFGVLFDDFGFAPADPDIRIANHGQPASYEYILETNPDWLFVLDRDAAIGSGGGNAAEKLLDNDIVRQTEAWKNGRVVYLDPVAWYLVPDGATSLRGSIEQLAGALAGK